MTGPTPRHRHPLLALLGVVACPLAACSGPIDAVANLEGLYASHGEDAATYSTEDPERNPVEFGIENLAEIWACEEDDLDDFGFARAIAAATEIGRSDPSKILRARGYETAAALWRSHPGGPFRFEAHPADEDELKKTCEPLEAVVAAKEDEREVLALGRSADIAAAAKAVGALRPDSFVTARRLLVLVARCGEAVEESDAAPATKQALHAAARALAGQAAFLSAMPDAENAAAGVRLHGAADDSGEARAGAGHLLLAVDPASATIELGKVWDRLRDPLVKIVLLKVLGDSGLAAEGVHPSLRGPLLHDLDPDEENAALRYWSRRTLTKLLKLDPEKASEGELRAKWMALGDWDVGARRS